MNITLEAGTADYMCWIFQHDEATGVKFKIISYKLEYGRPGPGSFSYHNPQDYLQENGYILRVY